MNAPMRTLLLFTLMLFVLTPVARAATDTRIEIALRSPDSPTVTQVYDVTDKDIADVQNVLRRREHFERRALRDYAEKRGYSRKVYGKDNFKLVNGLYIESIRVVAPGVDKQIYRHVRHTGAGREGDGSY